MPNNQTRLDDFKFDDFNLDDVGKSPARGRDGKKERGPIGKIATSFAAGAKETFTRPEHLRRFASSALPKGYGTAINTGHDVYSGGRELYNIAANELRPAMPAIRRATQKAMPHVKSFLPKSVTAQLEAFANRTDSSYRAPTQDEINDQQIAGELAGVFRTSLEFQAEQHARDQAERRIRDVVSDKVNRASLQRLDAIQQGIGRLTSYQDQVTHRFQQKSLELQYRQYFVLRDTLKHHVTTDDTNRRLLEGILHNTSLPDQVKLKLGEQASGNFRDRLINSFQQQASKYIGNFSKQLMENLRNSVRGATSSFGMGIQMGDDMAQQMADMRASGLMEDESFGQQAGRATGSLAAEAGGRFLSRKLRGVLGKNKAVNGFGSKLQFKLGSLPERLNQWAQSDDDDWSLRGIGRRMIKEIIPRFALDTRFGNSPVLEADKVATFDNITRRSIIEVIPGYLARIHQEVAAVRGGMGFKIDTKSRLMYNMDRGGFTTVDQATKDVKRRLFDPSAIAYARSSMASFLDSLDKNSELSPEARSALMRQILADTAAGRPFDPDRYSNFEEMTTELTGASKEEVAKLFQKHFKTADGGVNFDAINEARGKAASLRNTIPDPKKAMEVYDEVGYQELLEDMGLIIQKGFNNRLNLGKIWDNILNDAQSSTLVPDVKRQNVREYLQRRLDETFDSASSSVSNAASQAREAADVYLHNDVEPTLRAARMRAGDYIDQRTGKTVRTLSDITGSVLNRAGDVILSASDAAHGLIDKSGQLLKDLTTRLRNAKVTMFSGSGGFAGGIRSAVSSLSDRARSLTSASDPSGIVDLYVQGRVEPVIQAIRLQAGEYFDQLSGKAIQTLSDIEGPVVDRAGNVVLSAQDAASGLVEKSGRNRKDIVNKIKSRIEALRSRYLGGPSDNGGGIFGSNTEPQTGADTSNVAYSDELISLNSQQVELLKVIAEILATNGVVTAGGERPVVGFLDRLVLGGLKKSWSGVKFAGKAYAGYLKGIGGGVGALFKGAAKLTTGAAGTAFELIKGPLAGARDVYVAGNDYPSLTALKIKRRHYQDVNTGKPVKNIKSITGPVVDISENNEMVLTQEEFNRGLFVRKRNGFIRAGLATLRGAGKAIIGGYANLAKLPFMAISAGVKALKTGMTMMFNDQIDVYVMGEMQQPRLRAMLMKAGRYYSARTGKLIRGFKNIDGPVKELASGAQKASVNDAEVLSLDDFKKGLVDVRGRELKTPAQRLLGLAGRAAGGVLALGAGAVRMYGKLMGGALKGIGAVGGGVMNLFGNMMSQFFPQNNWLGRFTRKKEDDPSQILKDIYQLLDARLAKPERMREGSWQDQAADRAAEKKEELAAMAESKKGASEKGMLSAFSSWLMGQQDDEEDEDEEGDGGDTTIIGGGGSDNSRDRRGRKRGGFRRNTSARWKRGKRWMGRSKLGRLFGGGLGALGSLKGKIPGGRMLGKLKNFGFGMGGLAKGLALTLGGGYLINKLGGNKTTAGRAAGKTVDVAGNAMTAYSLASMAGLTSSGAAAAGGAGAGAAGAAGAAAGGGLLATIGLPVLIGTAAVGAVAYGGYKAFKKYKYGSYTPLRAYRMAQYGISYKDAGKVEKIVKLEQMLEPNVQNMGTGMDIASGKITINDVYKLFDLDDGWFSNNADERATFDVWFNKRFKPVFLSWKSKINGIKSGTNLNDVDDTLTQEEKNRLLKAVKSISADAYTVSVGPFDGDKLDIGPDGVEAAYAQAASTIESEKTASGKITGKLDRFAMAMAKMIPVPFASTLMEKSIQLRKKLYGGLFGGDKKQAAAKAAAASGITAAGAMAGAVLRGQATPKAPGSISTVSALKAIRLRAYGLTNMDATIVRALLVLEGDILRDLTYGADGAAQLDQTSSYYFDQYSGYFGLASDSKAVREKWCDWFENRFMPVLLAFASTVRSLDQSADPREAESRLKPAALVEVGNAIVGAKRTVFGFKLSIWSYSDSPWGKEPLNTDSRTVFDNLQALKEAVKKRTLDEDKSRAAGGKGSKGSASTAEANAANRQAASSSWTDRLKNWLMGDKDNPTLLAKGVDQAKSVAGTAYNTVAGWFGGGNAPSDAAGAGPIGAQVVHPGHGTGGNINDIPLPKGDGSWGAVKDTIIAAAKMAGVSPDLMATMAHIESNFRSGVKAGTSSATGLYQFITSTWNDMLRKYGAKYGIAPNTPRTDARANALMGAEFLKENIAYLKSKLKRDPTDTEMYMAHFMGAGGAGQILAALARNPNANAAAAFPKAAAANKPIFMNEDGSPRTIQGVVAEIDRRVRSRRMAVTPGALNHVAVAKAGAPATGGITTTTANGPTGGIGPNMGATPVLTSPSFNGALSSSSAPSGLPSGKGYGEMLAANDDTPQSTSVVPTSVYSSTPPVPSTNRSSGLPASTADGSVAFDAAAAQQRSLAQQAALATDLRGQEANAELSKSMASMVGILSQQLTVQQKMSDDISRSVTLLENIHGNTAVAAAGDGRFGKPTSSNTSTPSTARGARTADSTPSNPPVSVRRTSVG